MQLTFSLLSEVSSKPFPFPTISWALQKHWGNANSTWCVCMCMCVFVHVCVHMCTDTCTHTYTNIHTHTHAHTYTYVHTGKLHIIAAALWLYHYTTLQNVPFFVIFLSLLQLQLLHNWFELPCYYSCFLRAYLNNFSNLNAPVILQGEFRQSLFSNEDPKAGLFLGHVRHPRVLGWSLNGSISSRQAASLYLLW